MSWICDALVEKWGQGASWVKDEGEHPHEATYLKLDSSKAKSQLGWRSKLSLDQALNRIVEWNKVAMSGGDIRAATLTEISTYQTL